MRALALLPLMAACSGAPRVPPQTIWTEIVSAGCAAPDPQGPTFVAAQLDGHPQVWLSCLQSGGSVQSCHVPCGSAHSP